VIDIIRCAVDTSSVELATSYARIEQKKSDQMIASDMNFPIDRLLTDSWNAYIVTKLTARSGG